MGTNSIPSSEHACNRYLFAQFHNYIVGFFRAIMRALTTSGSGPLAFIIFPTLTTLHNVQPPPDWIGLLVLGMGLAVLATAVSVSQVEHNSVQIIGAPPDISPLTTLLNYIKRVIIYARVSSDEQAEIGTSLENQVEKSLARAQAIGMKVVAIFREDYTGITLDRPELNKARTMLRNGEAEAIIAFKTNRLDRSEWGINLLILLHEFKNLGVELHYSQSGRQVDLNNPTEALMQSIEGWQSGEDRNNIVRQLLDGRIKRVRGGGVLVSNKPPYGYRKGKEGNLCILVIDEVEERVIKLIFYWYTEGDNGRPLSIRQITNRLNEMKVPLASHTNHRLVNRKRKDILWRPGTVHQILKNETYAGVWYYNKKKKVNGKLVDRDRSEWIAVKVPAIVERTTYEAAQVRLIKNKENAGRIAKSQYLMSKRMKCQCGYKIAGIKDGRRSGKLYYGCPGRRTPKAMRHSCDLPYFITDTVDALIWQWVRGLFENEELLEQGIADYQARQAEIIKPLMEDLTLINQTIKEQEKQLSENAQALKLLGENPPSRTLANILADIKRTETQLDGLEGQRRKVQAQMKAVMMSKRDINQAIERVRQIKAELGEALNLADVTFEDKRFLIERLNVEATLLIENGQKVVKARCHLDERSFNCQLPYVADIYK